MSQALQLETFTGPRLLRSPLLAGTPHGFTDRHGGVSTGAEASLNLRLGEAVSRPKVHENRRRVLAALRCSERQWVCVRQVHGHQVVDVTASSSPHIEADALWTRDPKAVLTILVADCVPILLADVHGCVVAAVHAGWRGTALGVVQRTVNCLQAKAGITPDSLTAVLGPAIGPCCFKVGAETQAALQDTYAAAPAHVWRKGPQGATYADLWGLNQYALQKAGVFASQTHALRYCTQCRPEYFSYRRDAGVTGRQAGVIALRCTPYNGVGP